MMTCLWSLWGGSRKEYVFICWHCHRVRIERRGTDVRFLQDTNAVAPPDRKGADMNLYDVFPVGQRVRLSEEARRQGLYGPRAHRDFATVIGYSRDGTCVRIRFDGKKEPSSMHHTFIQPVPAPSPSPAQEQEPAAAANPWAAVGAK